MPSVGWCLLQREIQKLIQKQWEVSCYVTEYSWHALKERLILAAVVVRWLYLESETHLYIIGFF